MGRLITIYPGDADDFSTLGLGALTPTKCEVSWEAGGMYDVEIVHPVDAEKRWTLIDYGMIVKAPGPVREVPTVSAGQQSQTVTRQIYKVSTNGGRLRMRAKPSTSAKILASYKPGTQVMRLEVSGSWAKVIVVNGGKQGWMHTSYLTFVRTQTETIVGDKPGEIVEVKQVGDQLFRIYEVDRDAVEGQVIARAMHISYDLRAIGVKGDYSPKNVAVETVVAGILSRALAEHPFEIHCYVTGQVTGEFGGKSILDCLLEPETGIVAQTKARIIRDNYDIYLLPDQERDMGVELRYAKNLTGASMKVDAADIVTRIEAVGKTKDGKPLYLDGTGYVDSARIGNYPTVYAKRVEYDVQVSKDGINNATQARTKLRQMAQDDFSAGVDLPKVSLDVDFLNLGDTVEYAKYRELQAVHPYDTVSVEHPPLGISAKLRLTKCTWDSLAGRYSQTTLGEITSIKPTTFGYDIARGAVAGTKIATDAVDTQHMRDLSVGLAKIDTAAIETIIADSITALKGRFGDIIADKTVTDELYADMAKITVLMAEQITADTITTDALYAELARIITLRVQQVTAETIETDELYAALANVIVLRAEQASIGSAEIDDLRAALAEIVRLDARLADIDYAKIKDLLADEAIIQDGIAGQLYIRRLSVTQANLLNATIMNLVMPGEDGKYYAVVVGTDGVIRTEEVTVTEGEIAAGQTGDGRQIVATTINAGAIHGDTISAQSAIINTILTYALTAGKITAAEALIGSLAAPQLTATAISALAGSLNLTANEQITALAARAVNSGDSAPDPPENGALWMDTSAEPPVLKRYSGSAWTAISNRIVGTNASITPDGFSMATPNFNLTLYDPDDPENTYMELSGDSTGFKRLIAEEIVSGSVVAVRNAATRTIGSAATDDYATLQDALDRLCEACLEGDIVLEINTTTPQAGELRGLSGSGTLTIRPASGVASVIGQLRLLGCSAEVIVSGGAIASTATTDWAVYVKNAVLTVTGGCAIDAVKGIYCGRFSRAIVDDMTGECAEMAYCDKGGVLTIIGNAPSGTIAHAPGGQIYEAGIVQYVPVVPTPPSTIETRTTAYTATLSDTFASYWRQMKDIRQGAYDGLESRGAFWFNNTQLRSDLSGATDISAMLSLKRVAGTGQGGAVSVRLYGTTRASNSGAQPALSVNYGIIGTWANGGYGTVAIPATAINALVAGTIQGFVLHSTNTYVLSGKAYTSDYAKFSGVGGTPPKLTITYTKEVTV